MLYSQKLDWFLQSNDNFLDGIVNEICLDLEDNRSSYKGVDKDVKKKNDKLVIL